MEAVIGGRKTTAGKFRPLMVGVPKSDHLAYVGIVGTGYGQAVVKQIMPELEANAAKENPFGGAERSEKNLRRALAQARTRRRDRVRRLHGRSAWSGRPRSRDCERTSPASEVTADEPVRQKSRSLRSLHRQERQRRRPRRPSNLRTAPRSSVGVTISTGLA